MRFTEIRSIFFLIMVSAVPASAQWVKQAVDTKASFRGLSVVSEKVVWASGTGGTIIKTSDGGNTWKVMTVPGAEKLDFRDIEAFDANTAYILSIGNGGASRIYFTTDAGAHWTLLFKNEDEKAFYDALACWGKSHCVAMSDPVAGKFLLRSLTFHAMGNSNGVLAADMPAVKEGEAAFAASGTCLLAGRDGTLFLVSGGADARVFRSTDNGQTWTVSETPITRGTSGSGIFSIAMFDAKTGVIVGGNYEQPGEAKDNLAFTTDGGRTWKLGTGLGGYRSGVTYIDKKTLIAVGTNGSDLSRDGGLTWKNIGKEDLNAVAAKGKTSVWAAGPKGMVLKWDPVAAIR